jgi:hypothetical protein
MRKKMAGDKNDKPPREEHASWDTHAFYFFNSKISVFQQRNGMQYFHCISKRT